MWKIVWSLIRPRLHIFAIGIALLLIGRFAGLAVPASTKIMIDEIVLGRKPELLPGLITALLVASLIQAVCTYLIRKLISGSAHAEIASLRQRVQEHVQHLPLSFFDSTQSGKLVSRIMNDTDSIKHLFGAGFIDLIGGLITSIFALSLMVYINPTITLAILIGIGGFSFLMLKSFKVFGKYHEENQKIRTATVGRLQESISAIRVVKSYSAEAHEAQAFAKATNAMKDVTMKTVLAYGMMSLVIVILTGLMTSSILYIGATQILSGQMTIGSLFFYTTLVGFLIAPVMGLVEVGSSVNESLADLKKVHELLNEKSELFDENRGLVIGAAMRGDVRFDDVSFAYDKDKPVLSGISFSAPPGSVTALVGHSGAGKSSIINLVAGFYNATGGRVLVDGGDVSYVQLSSLRSRLGIVLQDTFLFDGTIKENVAFSRPGATDEEIKAACETANAHEFIEKLKDGYSTVVGERGIKLSGGQKQRISIARAVLANPKILILDEATSSLDSESEALVQEGLNRTMAGRTTFIIAHRLSTIKTATQILVLDGGRIAEAGTHESLIERNGLYAEMWSRQT